MHAPWWSLNEKFGILIITWWVFCTCVGKVNWEIITKCRIEAGGGGTTYIKYYIIITFNFQDLPFIVVIFIFLGIDT